MANPFLPLNTYIVDGEPHVFGNRVYLFGSHDKAGGDTYCMRNYEFWSAPVKIWKPGAARVYLTGQIRIRCMGKS